MSMNRADGGALRSALDRCQCAMPAFVAWDLEFAPELLLVLAAPRRRLWPSLQLWLFLRRGARRFQKLMSVEFFENSHSISPARLYGRANLETDPYCSAQNPCPFRSHRKDKLQRKSGSSYKRRHRYRKSWVESASCPQNRAF